MRLTILDETVEECKKAYKDGSSSGAVMGRVLDTGSEAHVYVAALPRATPDRHGRYGEIGRWKICQPCASRTPSVGADVELLISPDGGE